jgi:O-succinylbenzoic acid--CoA ligase
VDALVNLPEWSAGPGELVAVDLPPGPHWLTVVERVWAQGAALLPIDHRLASRERRAVLDLASPTWLIETSGAQVFAGAGLHQETGVVVATSGTAGAPKLVELSRAAIAAALDASGEALGCSPRDPWIACLSPAHIGGLLVLLRGAVLGTPVLVHERFDPQRLAALGPLSAYVSLVPTLVARAVTAGTDLSGFGALLVGGGSVDPGVLSAAAGLGARIVTTYGLTETCGGIAYDGLMLRDSRARFEGEEGQIELQGPSLMEGYLGDPAATGAAFTTDGWLRTGDCGRLDEEGRLVIQGRLDELIRTGEEKVWPQEIEAALVDHPKVRQVAVAGRPHPEWGQQVVAFVVPRLLEDPPTLAELRDHVADRIARFKAPRELSLVAELPMTASGKLRRSAL